MIATLKNENTGMMKQVKVGFSWTVFFFGFFPPLFRGDFKWAIILAALQIASGLFTAGMASFAISIVFSFMYNKLYVKELLNKGYAPASQADEDVLNRKDYLS